MNFPEMLPILKSIAKGITAQFGEKCEIVIHDLTDGYENTIVYIENGNISGRNIGDCASSIVLETLELRIEGKEIEDKLNYLTQTKDGRILRSTSIFIKNESGEPFGLVSINFDITELLMAENVLNSFTNTNSSREVKDVIPSNVNDLLDALVEESSKYIGKPVAMMSKEDKIKAIRYLDHKGAFLIKKAGDRISKFYDISKYTLYNYMDSEEL